MPSLSIPQTNPIRFCYPAAFATQSVEAQLFKTWGRPYFDQADYYQPLQKSDTIKVQVITDLTSPTLKLYPLAGGAVVYTVAGAEAVSALEAGGVPVVEFTPDLTGVAEGYYQPRIELTDDPTVYELIGEPVHIRTTHKGTILLEYYNNEGVSFGTYYLSGVTFRLRVPGRFIKPAHSNENTPFIGSDFTIDKVADTFQKAKLLEVFRVPPYIVETINLALAHDSLVIDGLACSGMDKLAHEYGDFNLMSSPSVRVPLAVNDWNNLHDAGTREGTAETDPGLVQTEDLQYVQLEQS